LEGKLKIKIPPGAFKRDAQVWVHTLSDFSKVDYLISENTVELVADYGDETEEIHTFEQPLEISMPYDAEKYRGNESMITMFYYDKTRWQWSPILSQVDMVNHTVTGYTNHFSLYATSAQDWNSAKMPTLDGFQVSSFTGAGTYSYPLEVPTGPGGLQPSLSFSYNSQAVDRATSYTQASQVGMGWSFDQGYIERNMHGSNDFLNDLSLEFK